MTKNRSELQDILTNSDGIITAEYVITHAARQRQRGKQPAIAYGNERNPIRALNIAQQELQAEKESKLSITEKLIGTAMCSYDSQTNTNLTVTKAIDVSNLSENVEDNPGPSIVCYGEDSHGVFAELRDASPDGGYGTGYFGMRISELIHDEAARSRFSVGCKEGLRDYFIGLVIGSAPKPIGAPVGTEPNKETLHYI